MSTCRPAMGMVVFEMFGGAGAPLARGLGVAMSAEISGQNNVRQSRVVLGIGYRPTMLEEEYKYTTLCGACLAPRQFGRGIYRALGRRMEG